MSSSSSGSCQLSQLSQKQLVTTREKSPTPGSVVYMGRTLSRGTCGFIEYARLRGFTKSNFDRLGPDILKLIARFIPLNSSGSFLAACKATATDEIRRGFLENRGDLIGRIFMTPEKLPESLVKAATIIAPSITSLTLNINRNNLLANNNELMRVSQVFSNVQSIHIKGQFLSSLVLRNIPHVFENITGLTIENNGVNGSSVKQEDAHYAVQHLRKLEELILISCKFQNNFDPSAERRPVKVTILKISPS